MSYARDTRSRVNGHGQSRQSQPIGPGKVTLTEALIGEAGSPGRGSSPVGSTGQGVQRKPQTPRTRDVSVDASGDGGAGAGAEADVAPPAPGGGAHVAATVVGSAADTEVALDGSFTPALLAALKARPDVSIDEVLQQVSAASLAWGTSAGG
ncbi:MAG TPA: hypothetical protein VF469_41575, partial [Kofleriaceae bacterium]